MKTARFILQVGLTISSKHVIESINVNQDIDNSETMIFMKTTDLSLLQKKSLLSIFENKI